MIKFELEKVKQQALSD